MIKKLVLAAVFAGSTFVAVPEAKAAGWETCLLIAGCSRIGGTWVCPDPRFYVDCVVPAH